MKHKTIIYKFSAHLKNQLVHHHSDRGCHLQSASEFEPIAKISEEF